MLRRVLIVIAGVVVAAVVAISWLGLAQVPVLSAAFGMDRARDLGMQSDRASFESFAGQYGITRPSPVENYTLSSKHHWSGSVEVDGNLGEAALGSLREFTTANSHVSQIQFRIHDGYVEMAAFVNVPGYPISGPVYGQFSIARTSSKTVAVDITQLDLGRVGVPGNVVDQVQTTLDGYLNKTIIEAGITIESLELQEGAIYFKGTWPKTITADAPNPNDIP
ncbi:MAG TPA: hypothetical protein VFC12_02555 [Terriglobales bacterium]|nr:hypothetical protein [Terriglobales bacterium]